MEDAYMRLAKTIKKGNKRAKNGLCLYYATIRSQSPLICNAADGEIVFAEGENLSLTADVKERLKSKNYVGKTIVVIGVQEFMTIGIIE